MDRYRLVVGRKGFPGHIVRTRAQTSYGAKRALVRYLRNYKKECWGEVEVWGKVEMAIGHSIDGKWQFLRWEKGIDRSGPFEGRLVETNQYQEGVFTREEKLSH